MLEKVILSYPEEKPRVRLFISLKPGPVIVYKVEDYFGSLIDSQASFVVRTLI